MYKKLITISFIINFNFMMLTTILPLIVFNINHSPEDIQVILMIFMLALLVIRGILLRIQVNPYKLIVLGSVLFTVGFMLLQLFPLNMSVLSIGSVLFGMAVGVIPPAILTIFSNSADKDTNIKVYNAIVALASVVSPLIGEKLYYSSQSSLYILWMILSIIMLLLAVRSLISVKGIQIEDNQRAMSSNNILKNREAINIFIILICCSVAYGAIVTYLPIHLASLSQSIGIYYMLFWGGYIIAQFIELKLIKNESSRILLLLSLMFVSQLFLYFFESQFMIYGSGLLFGFAYGSLFKVYYLEVSHFKSESDRSNAFAVIGLMSYLGVGLAPIFMTYFIGIELRLAFLVGSVFIAAVMLRQVLTVRE